MWREHLPHFQKCFQKFLNHDFYYVLVLFSSENDLCHPHQASWKIRLIVVGIEPTTVAIDIPGGKRSLVKKIIAQTTILKSHKNIDEV